MESNLIVSLSLFLIVAAASTDGLKLAFSARSLPPRDPGNGAPDAYINVYYAPSTSAQYRRIGTSDNISDNRNPDWPDTFDIPNNGGLTQMLKVDVYDADSDDYMGFVELRLQEIIDDIDGLLTKDLVGAEPVGGQLLIKRQSSMKATQN